MKIARLSLLFLTTTIAAFEDARRWCHDVQEGPVLDPQYGMGEEHYTILICHGLKEPLAQAWPKLKVWN